MSIFKFKLCETVYIKAGAVSLCGKTFSGRETGIVTRLGGTIDVNVNDKLFSFYEDDLENIADRSSDPLSLLRSALDGKGFGIDLSRYNGGFMP